MNGTATITLLELNQLVRDVIESDMPYEYWVEAELSECRESRGHCYMELVQKDDRTATPVARASAKCWANKWTTLRPFFERATGQPLHAGMKVLLKVYAQFHEVYGFSWIVTAIDPTYTLGDMARQRQEIISQLKREGIFDLQRELRLPLFCQRIAVISSSTAAGYGDFCNQLAENPYGFRFLTRLSPAVMQGEQVEQSIVAALEQIWFTAEDDEPGFDCVVIIRGGGATSDLSGFDTLALAENVANFPIPIITGIGHDRDECILDMVSHQRVKTPTAAAALLVDHLKEVLDAINRSQDIITRQAQAKMATLQAQLQAIGTKIPNIFTAIKTRQEARLDMVYSRMVNSYSNRIVRCTALLANVETRLPLIIDNKLQTAVHRIDMLEEKTKALDPARLLQRGYSITLKDGHAVRNADALSPGDVIVTRLAKGNVTSTVKATTSHQ